MKTHLYGPVVSRRLGRSLGVDVIPFKVCTFDCIYCQPGRTTRKTVRRHSYFSPDNILNEIKRALKSGITTDYICFSGSGEPTLNADLGQLIRGVKELAEVPVAVITNGSLLWNSKVRQELMAADLIMPSLDAGSTATFHRVNRPHSSLQLENIVAGLIDFRAQYKGEIRLEVMLLEGINTSPDDLGQIQELAVLIGPDRIDLNTAIRPPAESFAKPLAEKRLEEIRGLFGGRAQVISRPPSFRRRRCPQALRSAIIQMVGRRPCTAEDLVAALGRHPHDVAKSVGVLLEEGLISQKIYGQWRYFYISKK